MPRLWVWLLAGLVLLPLTASQATAGDGPLHDLHQFFARNLWPSDPFHFRSTDMRPVEVTLVQQDPSVAKDGVTMVLPRAWIAFVEYHSPLDYDSVPDRVATRSLELFLADPDMQALSIAAASEQYRGSGAAERLRQIESRVRLYKFEPPVRQDNAPQRMADAAIVERDGLPYDAKRDTYFLRIDDARLVEVHCLGRPHPVWFCDHIVWVNPNVFAIIKFVDFRTHGGPDYAAARVQRVLAALCRQSKSLC